MFVTFCNHYIYIYLFFFPVKLWVNESRAACGCCTMLHVFSRQCDKHPFTKVARAISSNLVGPYMNVTWIPQFQHIPTQHMNHPARFVDRFLKRSSAPWLWHCHTIQNWHSTKARPFSSHYLLKLLTCFADFVHVESESALKVNNFKLCQVTSTLHRKLTSVSDFWVHLFLSGKGCWFCRFLWSAKSPSVQQVSSYLNHHELACTLSPAKPRRKQQVWVQMHWQGTSYKPWRACPGSKDSRPTLKSVLEWSCTTPHKRCWTRLLGCWRNQQRCERIRPSDSTSTRQHHNVVQCCTIDNRWQ